MVSGGEIWEQAICVWPRQGGSASRHYNHIALQQAGEAMQEWVHSTLVFAMQNRADGAWQSCDGHGFLPRRANAARSGLVARRGGLAADQACTRQCVMPELFLRVQAAGQGPDGDPACQQHQNLCHRKAER